MPKSTYLKTAMQTPMNRDQMTDEYIMQYQQNCPDECEREMRKHLECLDHDEFIEEYEAYMN